MIQPTYRYKKKQLRNPDKKDNIGYLTIPELEPEVSWISIYRTIAPKSNYSRSGQLCPNTSSWNPIFVIPSS